MTLLAVTGVVLHETSKRLLITATTAIDRYGDRSRALGLGALHMMLGNFELVGGIELEPDRLAARRDGVLDRRGGLGGKYLQVVAGLGRPGHGRFAVGMVAP